MIRPVRSQEHLLEFTVRLTPNIMDDPKPYLFASSSTISTSLAALESSEVTKRSNTAFRKPTGIPAQFPRLLFSMLAHADKDGYANIASWQPHGKSFMIHNRTKFVEEVMPNYFKQTRFASFQRQMNLYGFQRIERKGHDHKSYYHERFRKTDPDLLSTIQRVHGGGSKIQATVSQYANWFPRPDPDFSVDVVVKSKKNRQRRKHTRVGSSSRVITPFPSTERSKPAAMHTKMIPSKVIECDNHIPLSTMSSMSVLMAAAASAQALPVNEE